LNVQSTQSVKLTVKHKDKQISDQEEIIKQLQYKVQTLKQTCEANLREQEEVSSHLRVQLGNAQEKIASLDTQVKEAVLRNSSAKEELKKLLEIYQTLQQQNVSLQQEKDTLQLNAKKYATDQEILDEVITLRNTVLVKVAEMRNVGVGHAKALQHVRLLREEVDDLKAEKNIDKNTINQLTQKVQELTTYKQMYEQLRQLENVQSPRGTASTAIVYNF